MKFHIPWIRIRCALRTIRIKEAVYDATTDTVTLRPVQRLNFHHRFRLTVIGTGPNGITDTFGNLLTVKRPANRGAIL